jgi:hypothetical protein
MIKTTLSKLVTLFMVIVLVLVAGIHLSASSKSSGIIERLMATITTQEYKEGHTTTTKNNFFYQSNGKVLTQFVEPHNFIVSINRQGEYQVYDPNTNVLSQGQNDSYRSDILFFNHFLSNRVNDLGLRDLGFVLDKTSFEEQLMITEWSPNTVTGDVAFKAVLVHKDHLPIFLGYEKLDGTPIRKMFFYNYQAIANVHLPTTMTEIHFFDNGDSTVSRTKYSDILVNEFARSNYFDFEVPADAILKK